MPLISLLCFTDSNPALCVLSGEQTESDSSYGSTVVSGTSFKSHGDQIETLLSDPEGLALPDEYSQVPPALLQGLLQYFKDACDIEDYVGFGIPSSRT